MASGRYYAQYNSSAPSPAPVTGWFDTALFGPGAELPAASNLLLLTEQQFSQRTSGSWAVSGGALVPYTPPVVTVSLKMQAVSAQAWVQQQATLASAMGEVFTEDMKDYVKAVNAIASGADTTSTALPARPTDILTS